MLKNQDGIAPTINSELHLDNNEDQKTHFGGVLTIFVKIAMFYLIFFGGRKMLFYESQNISSVEVSIAEKQAQKRVGDLNNIHFAILDHKDKYYSLDSVKRYINIKLIH